MVEGRDPVMDRRTIEGGIVVNPQQYDAATPKFGTTELLSSQALQ
jgi:hypothetical protein